MLKHTYQTLSITPALTMLGATNALAGYDIGAPSSGPFAKLGAWLQQYIDFMDGPFAVAAVVVSIILAIVIWNFSPREGIMSHVLKAVISGIVLLNIGTWIASFS
ncbi:MAG: hypothetical protein IPP74_07750 [Alphaproteobacteria bacterium]|nr:hypothetical protein [Alphaproteobacteria bacterium]